MSVRPNLMRVLLVSAIGFGAWLAVAGTASAAGLGMPSRAMIAHPSTAAQRSFCQPYSSLFPEPIAVDDTYDVKSGQSVTVAGLRDLSGPGGISANDYYIDSGADNPDVPIRTADTIYPNVVGTAYFYVVSGPIHGILSFGNDGTFTYQSGIAADASGTDSFTYFWQDDRLGFCSNTVTVTLNASPVRPVGIPDRYSVDGDTTLHVGDPAVQTGFPTGVLTNDQNSIVGGNGNLIAVLVDAHQVPGTLTWPTSGSGAEDGSFVYTPGASTEAGSFPLAYEACYFHEGSVGPYCSDPVYVEIQVRWTVRGHSDSYSVAENGVLHVGTAGQVSTGVYGNDFNNTGDAMSATITQPAHGSVAFNPVDGTFTYTPTQGYYSGFDPDTFTYTPCAGNWCSAPTTVSIAVNSVSPTATFQAPATVNGPFVTTFSDPAGQPQIGVTGVTTSDFTITAAGTTTPLTGSMVCKDSGGIVVNCGTSSVVTVSFQPTLKLVAGQTYDLNINNQPGLMFFICQQDLFAACMGPQVLTATVTTVYNLVKDGGLEKPGTSGAIKTVTAGDKIGPWHVTAGSVDDVPSGYWPAAAGQQSIDLAGTAPGTISESLTVPATGAYQIRFSLAGNPECAPTTKELGVWWDGSLMATRTFKISGHTVADLGWVKRSVKIPATAGAHTLGFSSLSAGSCGPTIDAVSMKQFFS